MPQFSNGLLSGLANPSFSRGVRQAGMTLGSLPGAKARQERLTGIDYNSPEGLEALAKESARQGNTAEAARLTGMARQMRVNEEATKAKGKLAKIQQSMDAIANSGASDAEKQRALQSLQAQANTLSETQGLNPQDYINMSSDAQDRVITRERQELAAKAQQSNLLANQLEQKQQKAADMYYSLPEGKQPGYLKVLKAQGMGELADTLETKTLNRNIQLQQLSQALAEKTAPVPTEGAQAAINSMMESPTRTGLQERFDSVKKQLEGTYSHPGHRAELVAELKSIVSAATQQSSKEVGSDLITRRQIEGQIRQLEELNIKYRPTKTEIEAYIDSNKTGWFSPNPDESDAITAMKAQFAETIRAQIEALKAQIPADRSGTMSAEDYLNNARGS